MKAKTTANMPDQPSALEVDLLRLPSVQALLDLWERSRDEPLAVRALEVLVLALPDASRARLEAFSVGERDRVLFWMRAQLFGKSMSSMVACPACQESLELEFNVNDVLVDAPSPEPFEVRLKGQWVQVRVPNASDLVAIASVRGAQAKQVLLERCVLSSSSRSGKHKPIRNAAMLEAINQAMLRADPQAVVELQMRCPNCAHAWNALLDITSYFWRELDAWAKRTLREVHWLARAYGWTESQILALSPNRRRLYLELVNA